MAIRRRAYVLMIAGIAIVMLAYGRLLVQPAHVSGLVPVVVAFLGFGVSTLGFFSFVGYEKRARLTFSLRSPVFEAEAGEPSARVRSGRGDRPKSRAPGRGGESIVRRWADHPNPN